MKQLVAPFIGCDTKIYTDTETGKEKEAFVFNAGRLTANGVFLIVGGLLGAFVI